MSTLFDKLLDFFLETSDNTIDLTGRAASIATDPPYSIDLQNNIWEVESMASSISPLQYLAFKAKVFDQIRYYPHQKQLPIHLSTARFRICCAGARFGKSMALAAEIVPLFLLPDKHIWLVGSQYELSEREFTWCMTFLSRIKLENGKSIVDLCQVSTPSKGPQSIKAPWGSYIETKSTQKPEGLLGVELDCIGLCEASQITRQPYERQLRARIGPRLGWLLAFSTGAGDVGLFPEFLERGEDPNFPDWESWSNLETRENPTFPKGEWEQAKRELDDKTFKEQYCGGLISTRDLVFRYFDRGKHLYEEDHPQMAYWPVIVGIQKGYQNPFVVLFAAINPEDNTVWVFDEIYQTQLLIKEVVEKINKYRPGRTVFMVVGDGHDEVLLEECQEQGLYVYYNESELKYSKQAAIIRKTQNVQKMLKIEEGEKPRVIFNKNKCPATIDDFESCKFPDAKKEGTDQAEIETPLEKHFQAPKALSHILAQVQDSNDIDIWAA